MFRLPIRPTNIHKRISVSLRTARATVCANGTPRACAGSDYKHASTRLFSGERITPSSGFHSASSIDRFEENDPWSRAKFRHVPLEGQPIHDSPSRSRSGTIQSAFPRIRSSLLIKGTTTRAFSSLTIFITRFVENGSSPMFTFRRSS